MDKPKCTTPKLTIKNKNGFALLITLSVLSIVIALTGVLLSYFDMVRKDALQTRAIMQGNIYYADIKETLEAFKNRKSVYSRLYQTPISLRGPKGKFSINIKCRPLGNAVNVNWLSMEESVESASQYDAVDKVFGYLADRYRIKEVSKLRELCLEEIGGNKKFVQKEQSRLRQKNGILSYKQFLSIVSRYQDEIDNPEIGNIPWEKYFSFIPAEKVAKNNFIDGNYLSVELIALLFDIDLYTVKDEWDEKKMTLKTFVEDNGAEYDVRLFSQQFMPQAQCEVSYLYGSKQFQFKFIDVKGQVKNFEFYGKK